MAEAVTPGFWDARAVPWRAGRAVIDSDINITVPAAATLFPYLADHWREHISQSAFKGPTDTAYPKGAPTTARPGTKPAGGPPGSSLDLVREQVLDAWGVEVGILNCTYAVESIHNPDAAAAMASATNDWIAAEWLAREPRLRASLVIPSQQPEMAAREIDRLGDHPGFVQVFLPVRSDRPYGNRIYLPIFEAAARHDLVVGLHFGGSPGNPPTAAGWPAYYVEEYVDMAVAFQTQLMSIIVEGVFDRFPRLRLACLESGFGWLPAYLWRFDKEWKGLRRETPWNKQLPSAYIREHVRFSTQPWDVPPGTADTLKVIEQIDGGNLLMFATDYPHWQFDTPTEALPPGLPDEMYTMILAENARAFYRL